MTAFVHGRRIRERSSSSSSSGIFAGCITIRLFAKFAVGYKEIRHLVNFALCVLQCRCAEKGLLPRWRQDHGPSSLHIVLASKFVLKNQPNCLWYAGFDCEFEHRMVWRAGVHTLRIIRKIGIQDVLRDLDIALTQSDMKRSESLRISFL